MRDPKRIRKVTEKLYQLWILMPDVRLGQLITILESKNNNGQDIFYIEDEEWEKWIDEEIERLTK